MITFLDGPAAGQHLTFLRTPIILRVVRDRNGTWDALNNLEDTPKPTEKIFVYRLVRRTGTMHASCRPRSKSFWSAIAEYCLCEQQPPTDRDARDTAAWRAWTESVKHLIKMPETNIQ